jgi:hypothetical protein
MTTGGPVQTPSGSVTAGDKISWTNNVGDTVDLNYPSCVSPDGSSSATVGDGVTTREETVNNGANGSYSYSYDWTAGDSQSGTIDVS